MSLGQSYIQDKLVVFQILFWEFKENVLLKKLVAKFSCQFHMFFWRWRTRRSGIFLQEIASHCFLFTTRVKSLKIINFIFPFVFCHPIDTYWFIGFLYLTGFWPFYLAWKNVVGTWRPLKFMKINLPILFRAKWIWTTYHGYNSFYGHWSVFLIEKFTKQWPTSNKLIT